jgi:hypothetical protein
MAVITKGHTFANGDQVTAAKLNNLADAATFASGAVDNVSTQLSGGGIIVKDGGVSTAKLADNSVTFAKLASSVLNAIYPVGSVYTNATDSTNPSTLLGFGTWVAFGAGRVPVGIDSSDTDFDTAEETGGAKTHTLTTSEIPAHTHTYSESSFGPDAEGVGGGFDPPTAVGRQEADSGSTGGGQAHNNLQPYIVVYMWKRTA